MTEGTGAHLEPSGPEPAGSVAPRRRFRRPTRLAGGSIAATVVVAMVAALGVPAMANAEPPSVTTGSGPAATLPAVLPQQPAAEAPGTLPLRDAVVVIVPASTTEQARAELESLVRREQQKQRQQQVAQAQQRQAAATQSQVRQVQQARVVQQRTAQAQQQAAAEAARDDANARLQEALQALAKALSTSQCTTVGGDAGGDASISCPLENGGQGTVSGGDGTTVTTAPTSTPTPTPTPSATSTPSPTPSPSPTTSPAPSDAASGDALTASSLPDTPVGPEAALTSSRLSSAVAQAKGEWAAAGGDVSGVSASISDLSGATLGRSSGSSITIDVDAAGWGWDEMSLITVVRHEIGHVLGLDHSGSGLMSSTLAPGQVRSVSSAPSLAPAPEPEPQPPPSPSRHPSRHRSPSRQPPRRPRLPTRPSRNLQARPRTPRSRPPARSRRPAKSRPPGDVAEDTDAPATTDETVASSAEAPTGEPATTEEPATAEEQATPEHAHEQATAEEPGATTDEAIPADEAGAADRAATPAWSVTDGEATLDLGESAATSTLTVDTTTGALIVTTEGATAALPLNRIVRIVLTSAFGTIVVTGKIHLTSRGLVIRARDVVVVRDTVLDTSGVAGDGDITLEASAHGAGTDARASSSVTVVGAHLRGGDITLSATSETSGEDVGESAGVTGSSSAIVSVVDSTLEASGDVLLTSDSRALGHADATGVGAHESMDDDAARADVVLTSRAESRLGGSSSASVDGALRVAATNRTDARSAADASDAGGGAGTATAVVQRTTRALIDGSSLWGIHAGSLDIDANSSGTMTVSSAGSGRGATSNTTDPMVLTFGAARTTEGPVTISSALSLGRVDSLTEAVVSSPDGEVLTLRTDGDKQVRARSRDSSSVSTDSELSALGTAVAVALPTLTARASVDGTVDADGPLVHLDAQLTDDTVVAATGGADGALTVGVGRRANDAGLAQEAVLRTAEDGTDVVMDAATDTTMAGTASTALTDGDTLVVVVTDTKTSAGSTTGPPSTAHGT